MAALRGGLGEDQIGIGGGGRGEAEKCNLVLQLCSGVLEAALKSKHEVRKVQRKSVRDSRRVRTKNISARPEASSNPRALNALKL